MARANRHHIPGYIWHITHRCHKREFLLKFEKDKKRWVDWLFQSKKRYGLSILNYTVTSNHIHLLVYDSNKDAISKSIQLIAGRTAREFNLRKKRKGAFWEDRYHATAVETGEHLIQCLVYIDLNMVRAGVVKHPSKWEYGGYNEIQKPKKRYTLIDRQKLCDILCFEDYSQFISSHRLWVESQLNNGANVRDTKWTESIAIGGKEFVTQTQNKLGIKAIGRNVIKDNDVYELRESQAPYGGDFEHRQVVFMSINSYVWNYHKTESKKIDNQ